MALPRVLRTKITPPPLNPRALPRPRIQQVLQEALQHRLTIVQAGAGYGKSTALTALAASHQPSIWYQMTGDDADVLVFLLHLCHATHLALPDLEELPVAFLESWDGTRGPLPASAVVDQYINALAGSLPAPTLLILDDIHLAAEASDISLLLDRLIGLAPHSLHIILAGRPPIQLPNLSRWRAQGEVLVIDQSDLAFTATEVASLFATHYGYELTPDEISELITATEGWAIALQMIWQSLRSGSSATLDEALLHQASSLDSLFEILAGEVFARQPADVQDFLLRSAVLHEMTPEICDALCDAPHGSSTAMLAYLRRQDLFVTETGGGSLRYHHIFHGFLRQLASPEQRREWNLRAAAFFQERQDPDTAIFHLLQAGDPAAAASLLDSYGPQLLASGRLDSLKGYLDAIPPDVLQQHPALLYYLGDLARLHSRFQEALGWYQQAGSLWQARSQPEGVARALRGQARVYLDTVNPRRAEELLQESIRVSDEMEGRESQARLYELLAENRLNAGRPDEAERLRQQAAALRAEGPSDSQLLYRVLLRTGRLDEARRKLEEQLQAERREPVHTPRAHRETLLLLSLVYAMQGQARQAYQMAQEGTQRGVELASPYITAVGHMRQGHALMLMPAPDRYIQAQQHYQETVRISQMVSVPRLLVECYWGLCRAAGYQGDLVQAQDTAQRGIEIASQAGDEWIASQLRLTTGASFTLAGRYEAAQDWLNRALLGFEECSDAFGRCVARLWLCLLWFRQKQHSLLAQTLPDVLGSCREQGYDFLFTRPTLQGPPDERMLVPLLIFARDQGWESRYAARMLEALGLPGIQLHPGYQLKVYTLGGFQVWRGAEQIPTNGWRREKARHLFQILITQRQAPLDRDQLIEYLWPQVDPVTAGRNFKVALNTLYQVLEPGREPGSESAYIVRDGTVYSLRPGADLWLDAQAFQDAVRRADSAAASPEEQLPLLQQALDLYNGEYLPDARYETWAAAEREQLSVQFLRIADRLSELLLQAGRSEECIETCQRILAQDNCWERAYRHLMMAFDRLGDHGQVARTYQRCMQTLREELDVDPSPETAALYRRLTGQDC